MAQSLDIEFHNISIETYLTVHKIIQVQIYLEMLISEELTY